MAAVTCTVDGCDRRLRSRVHCAMHHTRLKRHGDVQINLRPDAGYLSSHGYVVRGGRGGREYQHRLVLQEKLSGTEPRCHWCDHPLLWTGGKGKTRLQVDHLDSVQTNNAPANLVASCTGCNTMRGKLLVLETKPPVACDWCGTEFRPWTAQHRCCSDRCYRRARRRNRQRVAA